MSFERFTDRARKALAYAREEACRSGAAAIEPTHVFLGILREGNGLGCAALRSFDVVPEALLRAMQPPRVAHETLPPNACPFSAAARVAFDRAKEWAAAWNHNHVGTEHLILACLESGVSVPGVTPRTLADEILNLIGQTPHTRGPDGSTQTRVEIPAKYMLDWLLSRRIALYRRFLNADEDGYRTAYAEYAEAVRRYEAFAAESPAAGE